MIIILYEGLSVRGQTARYFMRNIIYCHYSLRVHRNCEWNKMEEKCKDCCVFFKGVFSAVDAGSSCPLVLVFSERSEHR